MTDEDETSLPALSPNQDSELLLYDYFKHLTTLSLISLGGVLTVAQIGDGGEVKPLLLIMVLVTIGLGGVASFGGASEIVRARFTGTPAHKSLSLYRISAPMLLALGVGMFLYVFVSSLGR
jgi:hypothetical protein